jgi:hypothetical protein
LWISFPFLFYSFFFFFFAFYYFYFFCSLLAIDYYEALILAIPFVFILFQAFDVKKEIDDRIKQQKRKTTTTIDWYAFNLPLREKKKRERERERERERQTD